MWQEKNSTQNCLSLRNTLSYITLMSRCRCTESTNEFQFLFSVVYQNVEAHTLQSFLAAIWNQVQLQGFRRCFGGQLVVGENGGSERAETKSKARNSAKNGEVENESESSFTIGTS